MLNSVIGVFLITFLGMFFLIGELLVKIKGLGLILGAGFMTVYFIENVSSINLLMMGGAFILGIGFIVFDGKFLGDGTISILGFIIVLTSIAFAASDWTSALYGMSGVIVGSISSLFLLKLFPRRDMWSKITLMDRLTSDLGYNTLKQSDRDILGEEGRTVTILRPSGTIEINGREYSAVSLSKWVEEDKAVKVVKVDGTKIVVEELKNSIN